LTTLVDLAYEHRAELKVESAKLESARLGEKIRWGELLPHVDMVFKFGRLANAFNIDNLSPKLKKQYDIMMEFTWNAGGNTVEYTFDNVKTAPSISEFEGGRGTQTTRNTMKFNILDGLEAFAEIKEAEVEKLDQIVELENKEKEVIREVKQAYFDYQRYLIQVYSAIKRLDYRERLKRLSKHRLDKNEIQISEYLQAGMDLLRERSELHKALTDYFTAKTELNRAVGLREFMPIKEPHGR